MICEDQEGSSLQTLIGAAAGGAGAAYTAKRFIGRGLGKIAATAGAGLIGAILGGFLAAPPPKCYPDPRYLQPLNSPPASSVVNGPSRNGQATVLQPDNSPERITLIPKFLTQINLPERETAQSVNVGNRNIVDIQFRYNYVSIKSTEDAGVTNIIIHSYA